MLVETIDARRHRSSPLCDPFAADGAAPSPAWRRHRTRVALVALLEGCVPSDHEVRSLCSWTPAPTGRATPGPVLSCDVAVRRTQAPDFSSTRAPVLCIDIANPSSSTSGLARGRAYARAGVDHYWYLHPKTASLETYVRTDDEFRHAETLYPDDDRADWIDFGVGVAVVALPALLDSPERVGTDAVTAAETTTDVLLHERIPAPMAR